MIQCTRYECRPIRLWYMYCTRLRLEEMLLPSYWIKLNAGWHIRYERRMNEYVGTARRCFFGIVLCLIWTCIWIWYMSSKNSSRCFATWWHRTVSTKQLARTVGLMEAENQKEACVIKEWRAWKRNDGQFPIRIKRERSEKGMTGNFQLVRNHARKEARENNRIKKWN